MQGVVAIIFLEVISDIIKCEFAVLDATSIATGNGIIDRMVWIDSL
jgi:hypothetical protein